MIKISPDFSSQIAAINDAVPSAMNKTYYVDAVNGSDTNDGLSWTYPFKTIKTAIDNIPEGGVGDIYVKGDVILDTIISINNKSVIIVANDYDTTNLIPTQVLQNTTDTDSKFVIGSKGFGYLQITGFDIIANRNSNPVNHWSNLFKIVGCKGIIKLGSYNTPFTLTVNYPMLNVEAGFAEVFVYGATIETTLTTTTPLVAVAFSGTGIYSEVNVIDNTGGIITRPAVKSIF